MDDVTLLSIEDAMAQRRAVLEPLLEMARSNDNLSTIRTLVLKALSHPQLFCGFDQIKREIQPLEGGEVLLRTLDLFSYGLYRDYAEAPASQFLPLTEGQVQKLRQLTVVSMIQQSCLNNTKGIVSYDQLANDLGFANDNSNDMYRNVEQVLISCVYARIISGRLCQRSKCFVISCLDGPPCQARDVQSVSQLLSIMTSLDNKLERTILSLSQDKTRTQLEQERNAEFWKRVEDDTTRLSAGQPTSWQQPETTSGNNNGTSRGRQAAAGGRPSSKRSRGGGTSISFQTGE